MNPIGIILLVFAAVMIVLMLSQLNFVARHFRRKKG